MSVNPMESVIPQPPQTQATTAAPAPELPIMKKYGGNLQAVDQGYWNAVNTLSATQAESQKKDERIQQLTQAVMQLSGNGGQPAFSDDPLAPLQTELGLPVEPFRKGIHQEVLSAVEQLLGPVLQQANAEEALAVEIPNFDTVKSDTRRFLSSNPEVSKLFGELRKADPIMAWKYAIREMAMSRAGGAPEVPPTAGVGGGMTPTGRGAATAGPSNEERQTQAWDYYKQYGDSRPALDERFKGTSVERQVTATLRQMGLLPPEGGSTVGW
jgi:hypothetical protein